MQSVSLFCRNIARLMRVLVALSTSLLVWVAFPVVASPAMVWSQQDDQAINVYFSPDGVKVRSLTTGGINIAPNLFKGERSTWLSWVDKSRRNANTLRYTQLSASGKVLRSGAIPDVQGDLYAPAIAMDSQARRVWLVWAVFNGNRENLYASYLDLDKRASGDWAVPLQLTPDDEYSANLPIITRVSYDSINIEWMRSSAKSSETASAKIRAGIWQTQRAMQGAPALTDKPARFEALSVRAMRDDVRLIKPLKPGQMLSADEAQWKRLVRGKKVLMGAVHSGAGVSSRLVEVQQ